MSLDSTTTLPMIPLHMIVCDFRITKPREMLQIATSSYVLLARLGLGPEGHHSNLLIDVLQPLETFATSFRRSTVCQRDTVASVISC